MGWHGWPTRDFRFAATCPAALTRLVQAAFLTAMAAVVALHDHTSIVAGIIRAVPAASALPLSWPHLRTAGVTPTRPASAEETTTRLNISLRATDDSVRR